ncbi:hypothetical protein ACVWZK_001091 [Bradyrhizobium sp. GM0.4]
MSKRVVDFLEAVEVEHEHGQVDATVASNCDGMLHPLPEQHAVGQIGQRVMLRHMSDFGLRPALLGHIEMCGNPSATGHWLPRHADQPTVGKLVDPA